MPPVLTLPLRRNPASRKPRELTCQHAGRSGRAMALQGASGARGGAVGSAPMPPNPSRLADRFGALERALEFN